MKNIILATLLSTTLSAYASNNWTSPNGAPVKSGTGLCWRNSSWTPATAHPDCDGALKAEPKVVVVETPKAAPAPKVEAPKPVVVKVSYASDAFFDFDKSVIKPAGKAKLDELVKQIKTIKLEVIIAVGHTDSIGTDAYNMKLGERRANAVKAYLVSQGVEANRIYTESKGEKQPVADNKTKEGRAKNRRVEIEVVGTK